MSIELDKCHITDQQTGNNSVYQISEYPVLAELRRKYGALVCGIAAVMRRYHSRYACHICMENRSQMDECGLATDAHI